MVKAANAAQEVPDTRTLILEVARTHLRRFGEDKMTIIGIARALGMSHANVYRYFPSKTAVIDAVLDAWLGRVENLLKEIFRREGTAAERIERLVMEIHGRRSAKFRQEPELFESFRRVIVSRPAAVARRQEKIAGVFQQLVEQGIEDGEFEPVNPMEMAAVLEDATAFFLHPAVMPSAMSNRGEERASNVVRRILASITVTAAAVPPARGIRPAAASY